MKLVVTNRAGERNVILYDAGDHPLVSRYTWRAEKHDHTHYAATTAMKNGRKTTLYMHRLILGLTDRAEQTDHINHNGLDNRRANLRRATHKQNQGNKLQQKNNLTSSYKGVTWHKKGQKWQAQIQGRYLGLFSNEAAAALAYDAAALELWGDFALLNNP